MNIFRLFRDAGLLFALFSITLFISGCSQNGEDKKSKPEILRLATTTSAVDSGLFAKLLPIYEKKNNIKVKVIPKGSGASLQLARDGGADVVFVHARQAEDKFIHEGYGLNRMDVMYEDFILLGPKNDPAGVKNTKNILNTFKKIADKKAKFISRGDNSGSNQREKQLWEVAGIEPSKHSWYKITGKNMLETMKTASDEKGYVFCSRSSYLFNKDKFDLEIVCEGDKRLFNPYGVIAVNPQKIPDANLSASMKFIDFITSKNAQDIIREDGKKRFGRPLFIPMKTN
jgi:tungstate transport system substrate-binding protein